MGYTHYWKRPREIPAGPFSRWAGDVEEILGFLSAAGEVAIRGRSGAGDPEVSPETVSFNGDGGRGLDCEAFVVDRRCPPSAKSDATANGLYLGSCKTGRNPYDVAVCAALIRLGRHVPEVEISSDGIADDWDPALSLCEEVFREGDELPGRVRG